MNQTIIQHRKEKIELSHYGTETKRFHETEVGRIGKTRPENTVINIAKLSGGTNASSESSELFGGVTSLELFYPLLFCFCSPLGD
jgi:hypothetical protein